jgi:ABC-type Na+ efflux pump permease subunit
MTKKKRKFLKFLLFFIVIPIFIISLIIGIINFIKSAKESAATDEYLDSLPSMSAEEFLKNDLERLKTEPSDIEGKTKYEKMEMGLSPNDGSDSDGDGLTDKEEIEVYGSRPT